MDTILLHKASPLKVCSPDAYSQLAEMRSNMSFNTGALQRTAAGAAFLASRRLTLRYKFKPVDVLMPIKVYFLYHELLRI